MLDSILDFACQAPVANFLLKYQLQRPPSAKILGPCSPALVLLQPLTDIDGNPGIQAVIGAPQQVNAPRH